MERDGVCGSATGKLIYFLPRDNKDQEKKSCVRLTRNPDWDEDAHRGKIDTNCFSAGTNCFDTIKSDFVFSSTFTTNIPKTLQPTNTGAEHTYIISKHQVIHNHISHSGSHAA